MVDYVRDAQEVVRRFRAYGFGNAPAQIAERIQMMPGVAADVICDGAELLYAYRDLLDDTGAQIMGEMFLHADQQGWTTFNANGRSAAIVSLVRRDLGEKGAGVAKASDDWPDPQTARRDGVDWRNAEPSDKA